MHVVINAQLVHTGMDYRGAGVSNYSRRLLRQMGQIVAETGTKTRLTAFTHAPDFMPAGINVAREPAAVAEAGATNRLGANRPAVARPQKQGGPAARSGQCVADARLGAGGCDGARSKLCTDAGEAVMVKTTLSDQGLRRQCTQSSQHHCSQPADRGRSGSLLSGQCRQDRGDLQRCR